MKTRNDDFSATYLRKRANTSCRNDAVINGYKKYCAHRKSTVVFATDIKHVDSLTDAFRRRAYNARSVTSETPYTKRVEILDDFREGKFPILINCGILTEGVDIPRIDSIVMARPTKSRVFIEQMLGRGLRIYPGKEDCLVLDYVDIINGETMHTIPELLGLTELHTIIAEDLNEEESVAADNIANGEVVAVDGIVNADGEEPVITNSCCDFSSVKGYNSLSRRSIQLSRDIG
ncbi:P-loop containing nucleoside triphosphate hydrolase protein [Gamsiella multidivaricata]|uniref:P-loop containing nucleoside triphosphate hydrolase protein n=1 Tax=Gamsiella multidivaricata TaxID=101098 RepID=UPI00221FE227|nr:P-loop containing nucleoside triphosphate hydrolase protein [Gamsiella multidivaricata]KAI7832241.1 P-loop containing nucleoside triphosphate hydrolase protein [Gamsiella multidivaricata]